MVDLYYWRVDGTELENQFPGKECGAQEKVKNLPSSYRHEWLKMKSITSTETGKSFITNT